MYAHILHHCRLVLRTYNFTSETVCYIKYYVFLYQTVQPFQDHLFELIDPNNLQNKISNVVGTQGSIQLIVDQLRYILIFWA